MFSVQADSQAAPTAMWQMLAEPARWSSWAPHIRGAVGLGQPEVELGRRGVVIVAFLAAVPVHITAKEPGRSWEWTTGPVRFRHAVEALDGGCRVRLEMEAPQPLEAVLAAAYGPLVRLVIRRLARLAAD